MRVYLVACIAAVVIAVGAFVVLSAVQKDVEVVFTSTGVRL